MSMQLSPSRGEKVTVGTIGSAFKRMVSNPDRIHPRSHNNTTVTLSCAVESIHEDDLVMSKQYSRWSAEYRVRPRREPSFSMLTVGFADVSGPDHDRMHDERVAYLEGLAQELQAAIGPTKFDTKSIGISLRVDYHMMIISIDLFEKL